MARASAVFLTPASCSRNIPMDVGFAKAIEITEAGHSPIQTDRAYEGSVHDAMPG
jgi:hypothetical protein